MKRWEAWSVHLSTVLVTGTGLVYAVMRYLMEPADPYAVVSHPLQPQVQHLHVLVAPLLVFCAGIIWREHVWKHFRNGVRSGRWSGVSLLLTLAPMVVSGYLIQTTVTESWRTAWIAVHLVTSGIWTLGYAGHAVAAVRRWAAGRKGRERQEPRSVVRGGEEEAGLAPAFPYPVNDSSANRGMPRGEGLKPVTRGE